MEYIKNILYVLNGVYLSARVKPFLQENTTEKNDSGSLHVQC